MIASILRRSRTALIALLLPLSMSAQAAVDESTARGLTSDLVTMVNAATAVIGGLQSDINGGTAAGKVDPEALIGGFRTGYAKSAGQAFDEKADGLTGESRRAFVVALRDTLTKFQPTMTKGGTDAFVPAFFRAELLKRYNTGMRGKVQGYATNRDNELINADWSVKQVMKGSALVGEVTTLLNAGGMDPVTKRVGDRFMSYAPMKLGGACVACHARNGLQQKEGAFGGALIAEAWIK